MTKETDKNLIPNNERTPDEVRENARKGGIKSGEVRREKKRMKEMLEMLLEKELTNSNGEKASTLEAIMTACVKRALKGDIKANIFIRDTIGQNPTQKIDVIGQVQKVFITPEQQKEAEAHIKKMIEE